MTRDINILPSLFYGKKEKEVLTRKNWLKETFIKHLHLSLRIITDWNHESKGGEFPISIQGFFHGTCIDFLDQLDAMMALILVMQLAFHPRLLCL